MNGGEAFEAEERAAASNFATAARQAGVRRIIYLGGLGHGEALSPHMRSRAETGNILRASGVPVIELQASIVIGSGSASFEMIRALVERLPAMITPRWVNTAAQPIAIEDVIEYLAAAAGLPVTRQPDVRNWRSGRHFLRWNHEGIRTATQLTAMDRAGAVPQPVIVQPVVDTDYAGLRGDWALSHRECPKSERRAESGGAGSVSHSTDGDPASDRARPEKRGSGRGANALVRCPRADASLQRTARVRTRCSDPRADHSSARHSRSGVRPDPSYWRPDRLVLRQPALEDSRFDRSSDGRGGHEARPARCGDSISRKHSGLLARGGLRAGLPAQTICRDEGPWPRLAGIPRETRRVLRR